MSRCYKRRCIVNSILHPAIILSNMTYRKQRQHTAGLSHIASYNLVLLEKDQNVTACSFDVAIATHKLTVLVAADV